MVTASVKREPSKTKSHVDVFRAKMEQLGLGVVASQQLAARLKVVDKLAEERHRRIEGGTPAEKLRDLRKKIEQTDRLLRQASFAWLRAASNQRFRRAVAGYESLLQQNIRDCLVVEEDLEGKDPVEQQGMVMQRQILTNMLYFEWAMFMNDMSYSDLDISLARDRTIFVQTTQTGRGMGIDLNKEAEKL